VPTVYELALLSQATYELDAELERQNTKIRDQGGFGSWHMGPTIRSDGGGFQAAVYNKGIDKVIAFRGTAGGGDYIADAALGFGSNSTYFALAEEFVEKHGGGSRVILTGHSLGGAIAQIVGNRQRRTICTFNAPGVAVLASRNLASTGPRRLAIRTAVMAVSAIRFPVQAYRDTISAFNPVHGLNVRLDMCPISQIGVHYGRVLTIPCTVDPQTLPKGGGIFKDHTIAFGKTELFYHSIDTLVASLESERNSVVRRTSIRPVH